jgi:Zn finger protein HypA/HybF involved in hydrogenase expression
MNELTCPKCNHVFLVEDYDHGECPNCGEAHYYWDDGWNYETEECVNEGFYWEILEE